MSTKVDTYQQQGTVGGGAVWVGRSVGAMGPRHASGGLGRTPNPGLAVCAGQRTRARRHRAPMGEGALLAKHCFASARTHSRQRLGRSGGLRRVLPTHTAPPSHGLPAVAVAVAVAVALALAVASAGAGCNPAEPLPQGQAGGAATHACCTSASDARSSSRHCGSNCAWWALVLHCVGSVRTAAAYHCTASCFCPMRHSASA